MALVPGRAPAARNGLGVAHAREDRRNPIAVLDPGMGGLAHGPVLAHHVQDLGPEPFGGIHPAAVPGEILAAPGLGQGVDLRGLGHGRVILPQHEHGVGIVLEPWLQGQGRALLVHGHGRGARCVHADARHGPGRALGPPGQHVAHGLLQPLHVIQGMLAKAVRGRVAIHALGPARIGEDVRGGLDAVRGVDEHRAHRVRAVVESDHVRVHGVPCLSGVVDRRHATGSGSAHDTRRWCASPA